MKVFISADIEGITGTTHWDETEKSKDDYLEFREQMTAEVVAACEGALRAGATEILVKDSHDSARNLIAAKLPPVASLSRGWSGHPYVMLEGLDSSFQAAMMIGYHSRAGSNASPLAHTMSGSDLYVKINGRYADEFMMAAYTAALENVPVVFVSGDAGLCADAADLIPAIGSVAVKQGIGNSTVNIHPQLAVERIQAGVQKALEGDLSRCLVRLPEHFTVEMSYRSPAKAYEMSFFPGACQTDARTILFEADHYFDVLKFFLFAF